jgi:hypothetical protein
MSGAALNLFYEEPDDDRWLPFDRYPRRLVRRIVRGPARPGGQRRMFMNLCAGLDRIGAAYRVNDYRHAAAHAGEIACIVGKPFVLDKRAWKNPIVFGAAVHSHPSDDPGLLARLPIRRILVPGEWMRRMCAPAWGDVVVTWPVGIDTDAWSTSGGAAGEVLLYDKILWDRPRNEALMLEPIRAALRRRGVAFREIRYGAYREEDYRAALARSRAMIFLCEHETQGIAYQQALACGVPLLAWDRQGPWLDPAYYPHRVVYGPVTGVPYWDERCGRRFQAIEEFEGAWEAFDAAARAGRYDPRAYILDNLTLEKCARRYVEIVRSVLDSPPPDRAPANREP